MKQINYFQIPFFLLIVLSACNQSGQKTPHPGSQVFEIAFMPDVHFHDLFADFESGRFQGLPVSYQGEERMAVVRTMDSQLNSTRLFNENYFAFLAALDGIAERGIKYVALPGDFSDDGQPAHIRGLASILNDYRERYGITFFLTPGNHDPTRPYATEDGKSDYLGESGMRQPVFSTKHPSCLKTDQKNSPEHSIPVTERHAVSCTDDVKELGYKGLYNYLGAFGLMPNGNELYYETPFTFDEDPLTPENSDPHSAENRIYEVCHEGAGGIYRQPHYTSCFDVPDMSYLVEPVEGIWLLALDTNVYIPRADADQSKKRDGNNFRGSGNAGYNRVISHKKHLIPWMTDVARRAEEKEKQLISFSHFPAADFYNGAGPLIEEVWGKDEFQMVRMPDSATTQVIASSGIGLHIAGHMHMNALEIVRDEKSGNLLTNIQVPSLAAYVPAFKILRMFAESDTIEVETVTLDSVPGFDTLFSLYEQEWSFLNSIDYEQIWNRDILDSETYFQFTDWHIRELSRLRFLPGEWPKDLRELLTNTTGRHLFVASFLPHTTRRENSWNTIKQKIDQAMKTGDASTDNTDPFQAAVRQALETTDSAGADWYEFGLWNGKTLSTDFYRIRNAGELALKHIPGDRTVHYSIIAEAFRKNNPDALRDSKDASSLYNSLYAVFKVMALLSNRLPGEHVKIDLSEGTVMPLQKPAEGMYDAK